MSGAPHTHFKKGTHVLVFMKNGEHFEDTWLDRYGKVVKLRQAGEVRVSKIRAMTFRKLGLQYRAATPADPPKESGQ